jgi:ketosteroid isomerase-like protein
MAKLCFASLLPITFTACVAADAPAATSSDVDGDAQASASHSRCAAYQAKLERMFDAATAGDIETFLGGFAPEAVFEVNTATLPWTGRWVGRDGILGMFGAITQHVVPTAYEIKTFTCDAANRRVVIQGTEQIKHINDDATLDFDNIEVWQFDRAGRVIGTRIYFDTDVVVDFIR